LEAAGTNKREDLSTSLGEGKVEKTQYKQVEWEVKSKQAKGGLSLLKRNISLGKGREGIGTLHLGNPGRVWQKRIFRDKSQRKKAIGTISLGEPNLQVRDEK